MTIQYSLTLYAFSNEFIHGLFSLEDCLRKGHEMGYTGVELVASQMIPEYPYPSDEWIDNFKGLLKKYEMKPVCYSAYIDMGTRTDRDLSEQEIIHSTINDMIIAKKLGFEMVRTQFAISPKIYEQMLPYCKQLHMMLVVEMHHPHTPEVPIWKEFIEVFKRGEGYLGVVPDFGIFAEHPHALHIAQAIENGAYKEKTEIIIEAHGNGTPKGELLRDRFNEAEKQFIDEVYAQYAPAHIEWLNLLFPYIKYVHGKFWYLLDGQKDTCIPVDKLLPRLTQLGYSGYIASEYEGHHFDANQSASIHLSRFVKMCNQIMEETK